MASIPEYVEKAKNKIEIQGGRLAVGCKLDMANSKVIGGIRGKVTTMSEAARRRLMRKFASLDWAKLSAAGTPIHFVTLTTPERYWKDDKGVYVALRRFRRLLADRYNLGKDYYGAIVRRERGSFRGMLHYHLVVFGAHGLHMRWISECWTDCLKYEALVRCDCQEPENPQHVAKYISKYCCKAAYDGADTDTKPPAPAEPRDEEAPGAGAPLSKAHSGPESEQESYEGYTGGRWWYIWGADSLPFAEITYIVGDDAEALGKRVKRFFRRWRVMKLEQAFLKKYPEAARFVKNKSVKWWATRTEARFCEFLRRGGPGFTILCSPDLLEQFLDAAAISYIGMGAVKVPF